MYRLVSNSQLSFLSLSLDTASPRVLYSVFYFFFLLKERIRPTRITTLMIYYNIVKTRRTLRWYILREQMASESSSNNKHGRGQTGLLWRGLAGGAGSMVARKKSPGRRRRAAVYYVRNAHRPATCSARDQLFPLSSPCYEWTPLPINSWCSVPPKNRPSVASRTILYYLCDYCRARLSNLFRVRFFVRFPCPQL